MKPRLQSAPFNSLEAVVVVERVDVVVRVSGMGRERAGGSDLEDRYWRVGQLTAIVAFDLDGNRNPVTTEAEFHVIHVPDSRGMWNLLQNRGELVFITDRPMTWSEALRVAANREARLVAPVVDFRQ